MHENTPLVYDYSQIFLEAIKPCIHYNIVQYGTLHDMLLGYMDVLEFVSPQHEPFGGLHSYRMGMPAQVGHVLCAAQEGPVPYERFIQFIGWLQMVQPEVVPQVMQEVSVNVQYRMFSDNFSMEQFRIVFKWDQQYAGALLFNEHDSHVHFMMRNPLLAIGKPLLFLNKLKEIVTVYGDKYLMYIPASNLHPTDTLVTSLLRSSEKTDFGAPDYPVLDYLIHTCPAALKVRSCDPRGHNAFSLLCERCNDPGIARHVWMVDNVMRYANRTDILDTVPAQKMTLLNYARKCKNVLVLHYIREMFGIE